jgi:hypothetical protein
MTDRLDRIQSDIDSYGLHVIIVPEDEEGPGFADSIGLYRTLVHPEVIIFGLDPTDPHGAVNQIAAEIRIGSRFDDGDTCSEILEGFPVLFRSVSVEFHEE